MRIRLRPARDTDAVLFYRLRLDQPETVGRPVASWQEHVDFFCRRLSEGARWFVVEAVDDVAEIARLFGGAQPEDPAGVLRLDWDERDQTWVSIVVDTRRRGQGVGLAALLALSDLTRGEPLWARIHETNAASLRLFARAGYRLLDSDGPWEIWRGLA